MRASSQDTPASVAEALLLQVAARPQSGIPGTPGPAEEITTGGAPSVAPQRAAQKPKAACGRARLRLCFPCPAVHGVTCKMGLQHALFGPTAQ